MFELCSEKHPQILSNLPLGEEKQISVVAELNCCQGVSGALQTEAEAQEPMSPPAQRAEEARRSRPSASSVLVHPDPPLLLVLEDQSRPPSSSTQEAPETQRRVGSTDQQVLVSLENLLQFPLFTRQII